MDLGESSSPPSSMQQRQAYHHLQQQPIMMIPTPFMPEHQTNHQGPNLLPEMMAPTLASIPQDPTYHHQQQLQAQTMFPPNVYTSGQQQQFLPEVMMPPNFFTTQHQQQLLPELMLPPNYSYATHDQQQLSAEIMTPPISYTTQHQHHLPFDATTSSEDINNVLNFSFDDSNQFTTHHPQLQPLEIMRPPISYTVRSSPSGGVRDDVSNMVPKKKRRVRSTKYLPPNRYLGRPPTSAKKQSDALGPPGNGFTPHVIIVPPGEDVTSLITAFSQQGPRAISVIAVHGMIRKITFCSAVGENVTMEGRFVIISLSSGSFMGDDSEENHDGSESKLNVSFANSQGEIFGGEVVGLMIAETPIQLVVGSYIIRDAKTPKSISSSTTAAPQSGLSIGNGGSGLDARLASNGSSSESSKDSDSGPNPQSHPAGYNNSDSQEPLSTPFMETFPDMGWSD